MPCYYCRHFSEYEGDTNHELGIVEGVRRKKGFCTLSPDWREVTGLHYCSQYSPVRAEYVGKFWVGMHEHGDRERQEQKLRIATEKKLKELRASIKEKQK